MPRDKLQRRQRAQQARQKICDFDAHDLDGYRVKNISP